MKYKSLKKSDLYYQAWTAYKWKHIINNITFVAVFALCATILSSSIPENYKIFLILFFMLGFLIRTNIVYYWRCPRCGKPFHMKWIVLGSTTECSHCHLKRWAPNDKEAPNQAL